MSSTMPDPEQGSVKAPCMNINTRGTGENEEGAIGKDSETLGNPLSCTEARELEN